MPILCEYLGCVYLCGRSEQPKWSGFVSLIASRNGEVSDHLPWVHEQYRSYASERLTRLEGIRFFPVARVRGVRVTPLSWSHLHDEPRVVCEVNERDMDWVKWFGREPEPYEERIALMNSVGWSWDIRDECGRRACRIDELELIEGPPPEGPF